ncbi:MAG: hypothetical protein AAGF83_20110 [Cyanobacteria bacterium P01_G01_bin.67]
MKKSTLALLTTVIAFTPLLCEAVSFRTAFAQGLQQLGSTRSGFPTVAQAQTSIQDNTNSAAAVGTANYIDQDATQHSLQQQLDLGAYGVPSYPDAQTSVQKNANEAAAVGNYNYIDQDATQTNIQDQVDLNQYLPHGYGY